MPDPKLVAYLRKTVPQYGAAPVKEKLIEEGVSESEIEEALAIAIKPAGRKPPVGVFVGLGAVAVGAVAVFLSLEKPKPASMSANPAAPTPADFGVSMDEPPAAPAATNTAASSTKGPYMGHYGYVVNVPPGFTTQNSFKDLGNKTEVVFLYKETTDPTHFMNEGLYGQLGILRLEVSPLRIAAGTIGIDSLRAGITKTLTNRGDTYELRDTSVGGLPGFVVKISQPFPLVQAFVVGSKVMYVLTGGVEDQTFRDTLNSLTEVSPHDRPKG